MYENDSLIEIAVELMEKKRKPHTIASIAKDVFEIKGLKISEYRDVLAQFQIDFMLSGYFICCGEDKKGCKLWDLKNRQPHELQDSEGVYLEDPYDDDEDVVKNELKDEYGYLNASESDFDTSYSDEDDEDDEEEKDDIEEELIMSDIYDTDKTKKRTIIDDDDDSDDDYDDR